MNVFCETYNLKNLITSRTCFKNPLNPSSINVILTNKSRSFQNSQFIETGISDHHKLTITALRTYFQKQSPVGIKYRNYKKFDMNLFHFELNKKLNDSSLNCTNYDEFEAIFMELLNSWAPIRKKYGRANNAPYMNKTLSKAIMTRSRVRNKSLKNPNNKNRGIYNKQRNYCVNLLIYVCTYMYAHICMHIYVCTYMYAHICMHIYVCTYMYAHICMHIYGCTYMYAHICMHIYVCTYMYAHTCMHIHVYMYAHTCMHICMHIYVCTYVCTYMHAHICMHIYMHIYACTYMHAHICMHIYACTYICIHICMYMYVNEYAVAIRLV